MILIAGAALWYRHYLRATSWIAYTDVPFGISLKYPPGWQLVDDLPKNQCCLFVVNVSISTTTTKNASGTPVVTVTAKEPIRLQMGYYTASFDPFTIGTTSEITLGKNKAYTGVSKGIPFYIIPKTPKEGVGVAVFSALESDPKWVKKTAESILSTIVLSSSTASTSAPR